MNIIRAGSDLVGSFLAENNTTVNNSISNLSGVLTQTLATQTFARAWGPMSLAIWQNVAFDAVKSAVASGDFPSVAKLVKSQCLTAIVSSVFLGVDIYLNGQDLLTAFSVTLFFGQAAMAAKAYSLSTVLFNELQN